MIMKPGNPFNKCNYFAVDTACRNKLEFIK